MITDERDCVRRAVGGDKDALSQLLEQFGPGVEAGLVISPIWRGVLDAADVMQVTYLEAFLQIRSFDPDRASSFGGWLRQIALNNLRDAIRGLEAQKNPPPRRQVDPYGPGPDLALFDLLTAGVGSPSRAARANEAGEALRSALAILPPAYSQAVQLYDLDGRGVAEVAGTMGRSPGAVYMLRSRAHERLRELLGSPSRILESRT